MRGEILRLAWPVFIGQLAVMANGLIDTIMAGQLSATDLAAVGLGSSIYISVYVSLMGVVMALSPIVAHHFGARARRAVGASFWQAVWVSLGLSLPGCLVLGWSEPWLALARAPTELAATVDAYLRYTAAGLPAALLFRCFYALNTGISRPKIVMAINLLGVAAKIPLNLLFMHGAASIGLPAMGGAGCALATALIAWASAIGALLWLRLDSGYLGFGLRRPVAPRAAAIGELLRLGLPIGVTYLVEVTAFTFMAILVARFGTIAMASHQVAANLAGVIYMVAMAMASATSTLVAQSLGAGELARARSLALTGIRLALAMVCALAALLWLLRAPIAGAYTGSAEVAAATLPLLGALAAFVIFDNLHTQIAFVLRAHKVATLPMLISVLSMWGLGLGGGWLLTIAAAEGSLLHGATHGALGFWIAGAAGLALACAGMGLLLARVWRSSGLSPVQPER
jgi:MATE family multidrug resistance protein